MRRLAIRLGFIRDEPTSSSTGGGSLRGNRVPRNFHESMSSQLSIERRWKGNSDLIHQINESEFMFRARSTGSSPIEYSSQLLSKAAAQDWRMSSGQTSLTTHLHGALDCLKYVHERLRSNFWFDSLEGESHPQKINCTTSRIAPPVEGPYSSPGGGVCATLLLKKDRRLVRNATQEY